MRKFYLVYFVFSTKKFSYAIIRLTFFKPFMHYSQTGRTFNVTLTYFLGLFRKN